MPSNSSGYGGPPVLRQLVASLPPEESADQVIEVAPGDGTEKPADGERTAQPSRLIAINLPFAASDGSPSGVTRSARRPEGRARRARGLPPRNPTRPAETDTAATQQLTLRALPQGSGASASVLAGRRETSVAENPRACARVAIADDSSAAFT